MPDKLRPEQNGKPADAVVLDDRERASSLDIFVERICGFAPRIERLQAGDILIGRRVLIERKTVADFAASVVDGRLFSQIAALRSLPFQIVVILEGEMTPQESRGVSAAAFRNAMASVMIDWQVPVIRSRSIEDTARWVLSILQRQQKGNDLPDWRWVTPTGQRRKPDEVMVRPLRAKTAPALSQRAQAIAMLSQVDGLGETKAKNLLARFGSVSAVLAATPKELEMVEGIGRTLSGKIYAVLHSKIR